MKKIFLLMAIVALQQVATAQKLRFKIAGAPDTTVHLIKYYGEKLFYADTVEMKNGIVEFDGAKQKPGIMAVLLPEQKYFEFIYNNEEVQIETTTEDFVKFMKVKKSEENRIFVDYIRYLNEKKILANQLVEQRKGTTEGELTYKTLTEQIENISKEVLAYQKSLISQNPNKLVSKIVQMSLEIEIPEAPKDENGKAIDSLFAYHYYRDHFFDNIDLTDDRVVNMPIFNAKLSTYFGRTMMVQHWDTIIKYGFELVDRLNPKSEVFKYTVTFLTTNFQKSKIMGMDKIFVMMADKYYCSKNAEGKSPAFWMTDDKLKELCEKIPAQKNTVLGVVPPNISLRDTTDKNWKDFYSLKSEYTVLYFWDPECGHCKKTTPKLEILYKEKLKERNVEIFAVGKAVGEDFQKWKDFIRKNKLTFINVGVTESLYKAALEDARQFVPKYTTIEALNYQTTFDIFSTPRIFVLDKNKKIIAKQLSMSQLEDLLDNLQGKKDAPKLMEPDKEEDEQMQGN
ncbi:MAG: redoxin domain-containing protein [Bacteroidetes bacterium]|nr:redoxin domain-containing protein [Bacteroidota bacterium]